MRKLILPVSILLLLLMIGGCGVSQKRRNEGETHYMLGVAYLRERNASAALKEFLIAAEKDPDNAANQNALGQAYQLKKALIEAERHYRMALKLDPDNPLFQNNLAALYLDMERWDEAIRYFRKAADTLTFSSPEVSLTGICYAKGQKGEYLEAAAACKEALSHNFRYAPAHLRLGETYYALNKTGQAIDEFRQTVDISPGYVIAHYRLGSAYMKVGQTDKARSSFQEVLRLAPDSELARSVVDHLKILQ